MHTNADYLPTYLLDEKPSRSYKASLAIWHNTVLPAT